VEFGAVSEAIARGSLRIGLGEPVPPAVGTGADVTALRRLVPASTAWAMELRQRHPSVTLFHAADILNAQRQIKTPYEQRVLRQSVQIAAEAHVEGMKATRVGGWEYEVEAAIEGWFLRNGALSWGYPSIVASGPNATVLHYIKSTRQMRDGDLLLVDAGCTFQGLTGDITRTYPVNGKFSAEQRAVYEVVLKAQAAGLAAATPGTRPADIQAATRRSIAEGLLALGLITEATPGAAQNAQTALWFPHSVIHGIGVDVHDPLGQLDPGAAFVIEPGVYIRPEALAELPSTPEMATFVERVTPAVNRYRQIGVRIEDSFLMTEDGPALLSGKAPKDISTIERLVGSGR
jgi:Xaa-Pro aminopeptidase